MSGAVFTRFGCFASLDSRFHPSWPPGAVFTYFGHFVPLGACLWASRHSRAICHVWCRFHPLGLPRRFHPFVPFHALRCTFVASRHGRAIAPLDGRFHPSLARVVGWPPVRSYRKNALADVVGSSKAKQAAKFVKLVVDGAPYLRKVDLEAYAGYDQLLCALQYKFFSHFTIRKFADDERKLVDAVNGTEYVPTYEDKDGDWMLVGDVPWK
ncbi:auxin-responsive protein IAA15-like isoform X2 [Phragmites australis]|nr:auxin-responsive protein IAA15-like isoform X2 [Phragmites australis]XP_062218630.1 auxin-responsive protein IAA15-like isoform X2 [Phragmites australis]XP_062218631.1 auxin-responsive protein IAA15-like isoform X2 [Phragmites australis]XP_062218632.1 auxin-responsive protein IAA15-like isoform X2 [Phragmites australis]